MIERQKGGQKTIAYKQLGLIMDIETKVVQHVSSPKESDLTTWQPKPYTPIPSLKTLFSLLNYTYMHAWQMYLVGLDA